MDEATRQAVAEKLSPKRQLMSLDADGVPPRADDVLFEGIHISAGTEFPVMFCIILSSLSSLLYLSD